MASGIKIAYEPKLKLVIVTDDTKSVTISTDPKVQLVVITAVPAAGGGDTVWVKMTPNGFFGPF